MIAPSVFGGLRVELVRAVPANLLPPRTSRTCNPGGGILLNLDAGLTVPGEGAGTGTAYPMSNHAGVVNYQARRSLTDLRAAVQTYRSVTLATTDELISWLNLGERNGHMHVAVGPPFPAVNCGEVVRLN